MTENIIDHFELTLSEAQDIIRKRGKRLAFNNYWPKRIVCKQ